jgi:hypothetical protein
MELALIKCIKEHGLAKAISEFKLVCKVYENKILLKYNQIESPMGCSETQDARGLILEKDTFRVMCLTFQKFFNAEEGHAAKIDWDSAHVLEKVDGSLMQLYWDWHKEEWCVATSGMAEAEGEVNNKMGTTFADLFWQTVEKVTDNVSKFKSALNKDCCYAFELTTPYNIVVTPHGESSITLLTIRYLPRLAELQYGVVSEIAHELGVKMVKMVKRFNLNVTDVGAIKRTFEGMPFTEEGYVVVDGNFNRIKIKNPAYVAVHHLKSKTSEHAIMDVVKSNEIEEFAATFPERKEEIFRLHVNYTKLLVTLNETWEELKGRLPKNITPAEKKKYAEAVFEVTKKNNVSMFTGLYFGLKDGKVENVREFMTEFDNRKLYKIL